MIDKQNDFYKNKKTIFLSIYDRYAKSIFRYCYYRVNSKETAEELMQDIFMTIWRMLIQDKQITNLNAFIYRSAHNKVIDHYRKNSLKKNKEQQIEIAVKNEKNLKSLSFDPKQEHINKSMVYEVLNILKLLPDSYQDVLILRYIEELNPKEIAQIFGTNAKNISAKINRAKKKLMFYYNNNKNHEKYE